VAYSTCLASLASSIDQFTITYKFCKVGFTKEILAYKYDARNRLLWKIFRNYYGLRKFLEITQNIPTYSIY